MLTKSSIAKHRRAIATRFLLLNGISAGFKEPLGPHLNGQHLQFQCRQFCVLAHWLLGHESLR